MLSSSFIIVSTLSVRINSLGEKETSRRIKQTDKKVNKVKMQKLVIQVKMPLGILMVDLMMYIIVMRNPKSSVVRKDETQYFTICQFSINMILLLHCSSSSPRPKTGV